MVSRISEQTPNIINDKGDVVSTITNFRFKVNRYILETGARSYFSTGSIDHQATLQVSYYHDRLAIASTGTNGRFNIYSPPDVDVTLPSAPARVSKPPPAS